MRSLKAVPFLLFLFVQNSLWCQDEGYPKEPSISIFAGLINYQGDLNPNSFTIGHANFTAGASLRLPLSRWFTARAGVNMGRVEAADRYNRDYLKARNLSFFSDIREAYAALEFDLLDISKSRFTPYLFGGIAVFHFNPWAYDKEGRKTYLKPLSTEGQGIPDFPSQHPYNLTQLSLPFGAGIRYALNENVNIGIEFTQRKTFTDYLDDVSSIYVDYQKLLDAKGPKAIEMAYRVIPGTTSSASYPAHGEQRGTPSEMDWYYFAGLNVEIRLNAISNLMNGFGSRDKSYQQRCPRRFF